MTRTALVLGATGGIGGEVMRALSTRGWAIKALHRDPERVQAQEPGVAWVRGDAMDAASVLSAAAGSDVIAHAVNPPGYRNWAGLQLPMLESTIAAAAATGARVLFPGTVYNYGPDVDAVVDEDAPQTPTSRKGRIRVAMEDRLREAQGRGVRTLVVRAGDFFGPHGGSSWLAQAMVPTPGPVKRVFNPGRAGAGHAWAYLPDLAETMARLLEREHELEGFARFNFGGDWFEDNRDFADAVRKAAGKPSAPIHPFPWVAVDLLAPFNETFREMREIRYLWRRPLRLDDGKLRRFLSDVPQTPLPIALRATLEGLGRTEPQTAPKEAAGSRCPQPSGAGDRPLSGKL